MDQAQINEILKLNKAFYKKAPFSSTRQSYWKGWGRAVDVISFIDHSTITVLDVGCGNGRFLGFLKERLSSREIKYTGLDNDGGLLEEGRGKYPDGVFLKKDVLEKSLAGRFDLVVCFGVTHHIPGSKLRDEFFNNIAETVGSGGYLILTFWNFDVKKTVEKLGETDFLLGWDNNPHLRRYCHLYNEKEKNDIVDLMGQRGLTLTSSFSDDGKNAGSNDYFIFHKIDTITP